MALPRAGLRSASGRFGVALGALALTLSGSVLAPVAASAAPAGGSNSSTGTPKTVGLHMRLVGFDPEVARAHGREIVTLPDGSTASVPVTQAEAARKGQYLPATGVLKKSAKSKSSRTPGDGVSPYGYGEANDPDCGMSWVALDPVGGAAANLGTGMKLIVDAGDPWDVHWNVNIDDRGGHSTQSYSEGDGFLGPFSWTAYTRRLHLTRGIAQATVVWYSSYTVTENGWFCWSEGPSATDQIW